MKRTASVLILMVGAGAAWAQTVSPARILDQAHNAAGQASAASTGAKQPTSVGTGSATHAGSPASAEPLGTAAKKVATPVTMSKPAAKPAASTKPAAPAKPAAKKDAAPAAAKATEPAAAGANATASTASKKRDPFVSPVTNQVIGPVGCTGGKKCLVIDQVALKGVVKAPNGMIAVIVNPGNKAYFMRVNDPVWNGFVVKITSDSIIFRETITDRIGRTSTREVVKKVNTPSV
jgi:Tfp pilus assembly protein PilP